MYLVFGNSEFVFINLIDSIFLLILDFIYFDLPLKCLKPPHISQIDPH